MAGSRVDQASINLEDIHVLNQSFSIIGLDAEGFAYIMHSYREKELDNKVMQLVAGRLDDEQIASLAVYFSKL